MPYIYHHKVGWTVCRPVTVEFRASPPGGFLTCPVDEWDLIVLLISGDHTLIVRNWRTDEIPMALI
jgi:hypothetical protein